MDSTSISLLRRLRDPQQQAAWQRFNQLYSPLIFQAAVAAGASVHDAADVVQDVMTLLVQKLREFEYDPARSFRGWLRTITVNKCRDHQRRAARQPVSAIEPTLDLEFPDATRLFTEQEYRKYVSGRALQLMKAQFTPNTWQACWMCVYDGQPTAEVAEKLGMTTNAVLIAKSRVLSHLREELDGLLD